MTKAMRHPEAAPWLRRAVRYHERHTILLMCSGKDALTWAQARGVLDRTPRKGRKVCAYHCPICRAWHVGSPLKKRRTLRSVE